MTKEIPLTKGYVTLVDDDMFDELSKYQWRDHKGYAIRSEYIGIDPVTQKKKKRHITMHRVILNAPAGALTDHRDMNKFNNQKHNLRLCSYAQNNCNRAKYKLMNFGYKGVSPRGGRWKSEIRQCRKKIHLGCFDTAKEAAIPYNKAAIDKHGEFAVLNEVS